MSEVIGGFVGLAAGCAFMFAFWWFVDRKVRRERRERRQRELAVFDGMIEDMKRSNPDW